MCDHTDSITKLKMASSENYDQNKRGWIMVATMFVCYLVVYGNLKALGVLLIPMTNDLDSDMWLVGWVLVFFGIMHHSMGPIVGAACRLLGSRPMMVLGGLLSTLGIMLTSISTSVLALTIVIIGLAGIGSALCLFISFAVMATYFKEKYALAVGISTLGVPVSTMVYGPMTQVLLDTYGWRRTMLLLGGVSFHLVACAMLMRRNPSSSSPDTEQYQEVPVSDEDEGKEWREGRICLNKTDTDGRSCSDQDHCARARQYCRLIMEAMDFALLADVRFVLLTGANSAGNFTYYAWLVYMVSHGQFQGLSSTQASFLPTAFGVGNAIGKLIVPLFQQVGIKPSMTFWGCFGASLVCVSLLLDAFVRPFIGQLALTGLVGVGYGVMFQAIDVMSRFITTDDRLVSVLGWQGLLSGVGGTLGGLIAGQIYEWTGSFSVALCLFAGMILLSIPLLVIEALYSKRKASVGQ
ncbi:monocarboxylate transporter 13-like [Patiria miniata]|uniref:Major facilitator superfamily (MFS) profile domain-containing protein n=1 Tax=Patiria miniata TaxID=46514 RepID=A0A914A296_PATMI|nr:monocarboxylate transporter 13-like [Patiria miniata]